MNIPPTTSPSQASPDISGPVKLIRRDRVMRMLGALGSLSLVAAGLLIFPYLSIRNAFDPGPPGLTFRISPLIRESDMPQATEPTEPAEPEPPEPTEPQPPEPQAPEPRDIMQSPPPRGPDTPETPPR